MKSQEDYLRLLDMFKLSLEVGRDTQDAYNLLIKSGVKVPSDVKYHVDYLMKKAQESTLKINRFIDQMTAKV